MESPIRKRRPYRSRLIGIFGLNAAPERAYLERSITQVNGAEYSTSGVARLVIWAFIF